MIGAFTEKVKAKMNDAAPDKEACSEIAGALRAMMGAVEKAGTAIVEPPLERAAERRGRSSSRSPRRNKEGE
eukprot:14722784-Alexandrium_andersonii.AAC.1